MRLAKLSRTNLPWEQHKICIYIFYEWFPSQILTQVYDAALPPVGLVQNQFTLLVAIHLFESVPITWLAQELFTDQTTLTRNIKLLEKRRLVSNWTEIFTN